MRLGNAFALLLIAGTTSAQRRKKHDCGPAVDILSAGSSTVFPLMVKMGEAYGGKNGVCRKSSVSVESGGSTSGAKRVCGVEDKVMIGNMSRDWKSSELTGREDDHDEHDDEDGHDGHGHDEDEHDEDEHDEDEHDEDEHDEDEHDEDEHDEDEHDEDEHDGDEHDEDEHDEDEHDEDEHEGDEHDEHEGEDPHSQSCLIGDTDVTITQMAIALDGITVATAKGSAAEECIDIMGGLDTQYLDQIFGEHNEEDSKLVWRDLNIDCARVPITIAGPGEEHGTHEFFMEQAFHSDETFSPNYKETEVEERVQFLKDNTGGMGIFGYVAYNQYIDDLSAIPIENNQGMYITPTTNTIADGSYSPLSRLLYINVDNTFMGKAYSFLKFVYSEQGSTIVEDVGYVPINLDSEMGQDIMHHIEEEAEENPARREMLRK